MGFYTNSQDYFISSFIANSSSNPAYSYPINYIERLLSSG